MTPDVAAGVALVAAGVAGLVAGVVVTVAALHRKPPADAQERRWDEITPFDAALQAVEGAVRTGNTRTSVEWPGRQPTSPYRDADLSVAGGIDDLARVARAAGVWVEDEDGAR